MEKLKNKGLIRSNSQGTLPELLKRKREEAEKAESDKIRIELLGFNKSNRVIRSPNKKEGTDFVKEAEQGTGKTEMEESLVEMKNMIQSLIVTVAGGNAELRDQIRKCEEGIRLEMAKREEEWNAEKREMQGQLDNMQKKMDLLEKKFEQDEREKRKKNITLKGDVLNCLEEPLKDSVMKFCKENIGVDVEVENAYVIKQKNLNTRIIVAKMKTLDEKILVLKNKYKLRRLSKKIYIDDDLTSEERRIRKEMLIWKKKEEMQGKVIKIGHKKVKIGENWLSWETVKSMQKNEKQ